MTEQTQKTLPGFKRGRQLGFTVLGFKEIGQTIAVEIVGMDTMITKDGDELEYASVIDLETGEEARMWLDGSLRHNLTLAKKENKDKFGFALEIEYLGKKPAMVRIEKPDGKFTMEEKDVNTYKFWKLEVTDKSQSN